MSFPWSIVILLAVVVGIGYGAFMYLDEFSTVECASQGYIKQNTFFNDGVVKYYDADGVFLAECPSAGRTDQISAACKAAIAYCRN